MLAASELTVSDAVPFVSGTAPRAKLPSVNETVPVGVPLPCAVTLAVKVTDCPKLEGLSEDTNAVAVAVLVFGEILATKAETVLGCVGCSALSVGKSVENVSPAT